MEIIDTSSCTLNQRARHFLLGFRYIVNCLFLCAVIVGVVIVCVGLFLSISCFTRSSDLWMSVAALALFVSVPVIQTVLSVLYVSLTLYVS